MVLPVDAYGDIQEEQHSRAATDQDMDEKAGVHKQAAHHADDTVTVAAPSLPRHARAGHAKQQ
jgi:hypothetical protein